MNRLEGILKRIDGRGYKAYKDIKGQYDFEEFVLRVDHVQGDPFAEPSRVSVVTSLPRTWIQESMFEDRVRAVALRDFVARLFSRAVGKLGRRSRGSGKSGLILVDSPGQEVLERSACLLGNGFVEVRFKVGLPAAGRRVLSREATALLFNDVPRLVKETFQPDHSDAAWEHIKCVEDAHVARCQLASKGLVVFIARGSILPRQSGIDDRPMHSGAVPFEPIPPSLEIDLLLPHAGTVTGLGIPTGVTLIVGGGYHGKSTVLKAISAGIYNHIPGDGRELVVTDENALTIRAEDGRRVEKVDISAFIAALPFSKSTTSFSTEDASGSTSQAANIVEGLEAGATTLIIDEDTSATNFMIRDHRMQKLVAREQEPIIPFIDRVKELDSSLGVSTILVLGGSGDYFDVADHVIQMHEYRPLDVTDDVREVCRQYPARRDNESTAPLTRGAPRIPLPCSFDPSRGRRAEKVRSMETRAILFGSEEIDISLVEQLLDSSQTRFIADVILYIHRNYMDDRTPLPQLIQKALSDVRSGTLDTLTHGRFGNRAVARSLEIAAAINRLRTLDICR
jgi:predicted ABC-class ATPase